MAGVFGVDDHHRARFGRRAAADLEPFGQVGPAADGERLVYRQAAGIKSSNAGIKTINIKTTDKWPASPETELSPFLVEE